MSTPTGGRRRPIRWIALFFGVVAPLTELASIIGVGQWVGVGRTVLLLLAGVVVGTVVISAQGRRALSRAREDLSRTQAQMTGVAPPAPDPSRPVRGRGWLLLAGVLFVAPGFASDLVALALLVPPVRTAASAALAALGIRWFRTVEDRFVAPGSPLRGDVVPGDVVDPSGPRREVRDPDVIEGRIVDE